MQHKGHALYAASAYCTMKPDYPGKRRPKAVIR